MSDEERLRALQYTAPYRIGIFDERAYSTLRITEPADSDEPIDQPMYRQLPVTSVIIGRRHINLICTAITAATTIRQQMRARPDDRCDMRPSWINIHAS